MRGTLCAKDSFSLTAALALSDKGLLSVTAYFQRNFLKRKTRNTYTFSIGTNYKKHFSLGA